VKIGFEVALRLLRDGAKVTLTTRFPADAARRFAAHPLAGTWSDRLRIVGLDLRDPRQVLSWCELLRQAGEPIDLLINNAAQTVRRPEWAYLPLREAEAKAQPEALDRGLIELAPGFDINQAGTELGLPPTLSALPTLTTLQEAVPLAAGPAPSADSHATLAVPTAARVPDASGLLTDLSPQNAWSQAIGEVQPQDLLEVQLINAVAPFLLLDRLRPLLEAAPAQRKYVVNVSAVEGWFSAPYKSHRHPHTNMAKAALNMMTRTVADELAAAGVFVSSVDTGWITDENPHPLKERQAEAGWRPPLDVSDGAARIYHPIVSGEAGEPLSGVFLKDYRPRPW
jgi:NAD(P)-dependent dehydrogenase (short-subunit alcohol dehydrogenase family)